VFLEIVLLVVGLVLSVVLGHVFSSGTTWQAKTYDSILTGLMGTVAILLIQVRLSSNDVTTALLKVENPADARKLDDAIESEKMESFRSALVDLRDRTDDVYQEASRGDINLTDAKQVVNEWGRMFRGAQTSVLATNYISEKFWTEDPEFSRTQDNVHRNAISNGVTVSRIFIFDSTDAAQLQLLRKISEQQKRLKIEVRYLLRPVLEKSDEYLESKAHLGGTIDFVVFDRQAVLLTIHRPDTREIRHGQLSRARDRVDAAMRLHSTSWNLASDTIEAAVVRGNAP
jgi:hypothetical protein